MAVTGTFLCKTCDSKLKARQAAEHHKRGHEVWYVDAETGTPTHRYGERAPEPKISGDGDRHILEHFKGYEKETADYVFVIHGATGKIKDMRLEFPLLFPIYELAKKSMDYKGTFPQFLADSVETLFASVGYELALSPKRQRQVYDEVARLKREGKIDVVDEGERIRLEVVYGHKAENSEAPVGAGRDNDKSSAEEGAEKEPTQPE